MKGALAERNRSKRLGKERKLPDQRTAFVIYIFIAMAMRTFEILLAPILVVVARLPRVRCCLEEAGAVEQDATSRPTRGPRFVDEVGVACFIRSSSSNTSPSHFQPSFERDSIWLPVAISPNICSGCPVHPGSSSLQNHIPFQNSPHHIATSIGKHQRLDL